MRGDTENGFTDACPWRRRRRRNPWSKGFFHVARSAAQSFVDSVDAPISTFDPIMYCIISRNKVIPKKSFQLVWQRWKGLWSNSKLTVARWTLISDSLKQKLQNSSAGPKELNQVKRDLLKFITVPIMKLYPGSQFERAKGKDMGKKLWPKQDGWHSMTLDLMSTSFNAQLMFKL